jgi:hypothetical protein
MDQRQVGGQIDDKSAIHQTVAAALHGRVDDVGWIGPFGVRLHAIAADARGIEQVLDVVIETFGLVAHVVNERGQLLLVSQRWCGAEHCCGSEN